MPFLFPKPFPDELATTHLYRVYALNNIRADRLFCEATKKHRPENCNHPWTWIHKHHIMSDLSGMTPQTYRARHTLMPLTTSWNKVRSPDPVKESNSSVYAYPRFDSEGIAAAYPSKICPDCRTEDLKLFSMTYWHRDHQIPGLDICPWHKTPLEKFKSEQAYWIPNPASMQGGERRIPDMELVTANHHPIIKKYQDIALLVLKNAQHVRFDFAHKKLLERAMDLGLCENRLSYTGHYSYIESSIEQYLYSRIPRAWMAEHFSGRFLDKTFSPSLWESAEYQTGLREVHTILKPVFVLLTLAALFESTVEICSILFEPQARLALPDS